MYVIQLIRKLNKYNAWYCISPGITNKPSKLARHDLVILELVDNR